MPKQTQRPVAQTQPTPPAPATVAQPEVVPDPVQKPSSQPSRQSVPEPEIQEEETYVNTQQLQEIDNFVNAQQTMQRGDDTYQNMEEIQKHQQQQQQAVAHDEDEWATEAEPQPEKIDVKSPITSPTSPKAIASNENIYGNIEAIQANEAANGHQGASAAGAGAEQHHPEEEIVLNPDDPGVTAVALYDYQAAAEDEISFDPDDVITHIEMVSAAGLIF